MDRSLVIDMPRDKYVERCKQAAFDYLDQGDLEKAVTSFVGNMNARLDCQLPHHLATLGAVLLMANDALGWWTLIEGEMISRKAAMMEITIMSSRTVWVGVAICTDAAAAWDGGPGLLEPARSGGTA